MKIKTVGYCVEQGVINLYKNRLMSLASIGTISACLLVIGIFYAIVANVDYMVDSIQNNIGIAVFFDEDITGQQINDLKISIGKREEVFSINYISADQAWSNFKSKYFKGKEQLLEGFEKENPLQNSASFQVFLADISAQAQLVDYISALPGVRYIQESREVTDIITNISKL
ncbi:MAG: ABC transporter permease, partial [Vallitaleaceae bacterium]|nr:ABC transporter permease [Vallitaleaceae bacterium]